MCSVKSTGRSTVSSVAQQVRQSGGPIKFCLARSLQAGHDFADQLRLALGVARIGHVRVGTCTSGCAQISVQRFS